jgi:threonine synthase
MRYLSTRTPSVYFTFEEAVLGGYAPDGGLYVPESMPRINADVLKEWAKLSYVDLSTELLSLLITEMTREEIREICRTSYAGFEEPTVPVVELKAGSVFVAELFHGPTFCFKDLGLRILINFMASFARKRNQRITLLAATTGDTGPAAVQAVQDSGCDLLSIVVHYPKGQISDFQRKQLTTIDSPRVKIAEFCGSGDDMDAPIKSITSDKTMASKGRLVCGINSFNIGRPLAQMTHFVWTYLRIAESMDICPGDPNFKLDIVIPTGAMGNMAAGYMAKQMGVPFGVFTAGVNINDFTDTAFKTGLLAKATDPMKMSLSEAINIQLPYNLERLLFYLTDENHTLINHWYKDLTEKGKVVLDDGWLAKLQTEFRSARVPDDELCAVTREVLKEFDYWTDPHTGVACAAAKRWGYFKTEKEPTNSATVAIMATASPCKFQAAMTTTVGEEKWKEYDVKHFPERGREVSQKVEIPPIIYPAGAGASLDENQKAWENMTRDLIATL